MIIEGFREFGGKHPVTASLRNVLAHLGVRAPQTGEPLTEAMLLGIGGGLGGLYFVFQSALGPILVIGGRFLCDTSKPTFFERTCDRLGLAWGARETPSPSEARRHLREAIEEGTPAVVRLDLASLPYVAMPPALERFFGHMAVAYGIDEDRDRVLLSDRSARPVTLSTEELSRARRAIPSFKNKILLVAPPEGGGGAITDLRPAVRMGIRDCCRGMLRPRSPSSGLGAWSKWAHLIEHPGSHTGWPRVFRPGLPLYSGLTWVFTSIETWGTGGSAFRSMYAEFLEQASALPGLASLGECAREFRGIAGVWSSLARSALPDSVEALHETRDLILSKERLFEAEGMDALERIRGINSRLEGVRQEMKRHFPLGKGEVEGLLENLKEHIERIRELEERAFTHLESTVGRE